MAKQYKPLDNPLPSLPSGIPKELLAFQDIDVLGAMREYEQLENAQLVNQARQQQNDEKAFDLELDGLQRERTKEMYEAGSTLEEIQDEMQRIGLQQGVAPTKEDKMKEAMQVAQLFNVFKDYGTPESLVPMMEAVGVQGDGNIRSGLPKYQKAFGDKMYDLATQESWATKTKDSKDTKDKSNKIPKKTYYVSGDDAFRAVITDNADVLEQFSDMGARVSTEKPKVGKDEGLWTEKQARDFIENANPNQQKSKEVNPNQVVKTGTHSSGRKVGLLSNGKRIFLDTGEEVG